MEKFLGIGELDIIHNIPKEIASYSNSNKVLKTAVIVLCVLCVIGIGISAKLYADKKYNKVKINVKDKDDSIV